MNSPSDGECVGAVVKVDLAENWPTEVKRRPSDTPDAHVCCRRACREIGSPIQQSAGLRLIEEFLRRQWEFLKIWGDRDFYCWCSRLRLQRRSQQMSKFNWKMALTHQKTHIVGRDERVFCIYRIVVKCGKRCDGSWGWFGFVIGDGSLVNSVVRLEPSGSRRGLKGRHREWNQQSASVDRR